MAKKTEGGYSPAAIRLIYKVIAQHPNNKQEAFKFLAGKLGRTAAAVSAWYYANENKRKKAAAQENGQMETKVAAEVATKPTGEISVVIGYMVNLLDKEEKTALAKKLVAELF